MVQVAFYLMNYKGYTTLKSFTKKYGAGAVAYIVTSEDKAIKKDYADEIFEFAKNLNIRVFDKSEDFSDFERDLDIYKFAIGWRWIIKDEKNLIIFHDSLLPKYRGFAPLVNSLINK